MKERPPSEDEELDERYRCASARDASRPSESVRRAVMRHAADLAAQRAAQNDPVPIAPDEQARDAGDGGGIGAVRFDMERPAANERRRRPAAYGGLAAAALAGFLIAPHFLPPSPPPVSSSSPPAVLSASKKTEAASTNPIEAPQAVGAEATPAPPLPGLSARRAPGPAIPAPATSASTMREPTQSYNAAPAPRADVPAGTSGAPSAASDATLDVAAKPRAFEGEARLSENPGEFIGGATPSAPQAPNTGLQRAPAPPPAQVVGSGTVSALAAARARAPIDSATALRRAAQGGDISRLKALLDEPIEVDARDPAGRTALMLAVISDQAQAVHALLARGADPNATDSSGTTPLAAALAANQADIIAALRRAGAH